MKKNSYKIIIQTSSNFNGPECLRTVLPDVDFNSINGCRTTISEDKSSKFINNHPQKHDPTECRVVLEDILADGSTAKYKMLNGNLDKTDSVPSHQPSERKYLDSLIKKDPIAWPKMSNEDD